MVINHELYHGSKNKFSEFELPKFHDHGGKLGYGVYLTDNQERARSYANEGYLYTINLSDQLKESKPLSDSQVTLNVDQVSKIVEKISQKQIDEEGYPYLLSNYEEPSSELSMDEGNLNLAREIAEKIVVDDSDLDIVNELNNELGGGNDGAEILNPILNEMGIHYAVIEAEEFDGNKEYVIFNPKDIKISNRQEIKLLNEQNKSIETTENLVEVAKDNLLVKASNPVEAVKKIYNNNLQSAIQESFTLSDVSEEEAQYFLKTVKWEDVANIENSNNALKYHGNGLYSDKYIEPDPHNPYQENTKILSNNSQKNLSEQYKNLNKQNKDDFKDDLTKGESPNMADTGKEVNDTKGKGFTEEERQAYAEEKKQQMNNLGTLKDGMLEEVFKDNNSFKEYVNDNADIIGRMGITNQFSVAVDSPGVREIGTRSKWNRLGLYPKNEDAKGNVVVPKKYADENGEVRQGFQIEPYFTPESFKNVEIKKRDENGKVVSVETKDLSKVAAVKYHESQNDFQTARDSRYKAYIVGLDDAKLNTNVNMNPEEAFKSNTVKYVAMRDLRVTKSEFDLGEVGNKFDVSKVKPEHRESFLKDIHKKAQGIINTAERQLKDAPHYTQDMFKKNGKEKER